MEMATTTGPTSQLRERGAEASAQMREREAEAEARRLGAQGTAAYEGAKRDVLQKARETGDVVRHTAEDVAARAQGYSARVADKTCEVCGQMRRKYPGLLTALLVISAFLIGCGLVSTLSRVGLMGSGGGYYGGDAQSREMHRALDTLMKQYQAGGVTGMARQKFDEARESVGGGLKGFLGSHGWGSGAGRGGGGSGWFGGGGGDYEYGGRGGEGAVMRTVHDAESKLAELLHGGGHMMHAAGERVRPK